MIGNIEYFFDKELLPYFLIGFIDGDGCIWMTRGEKGPQIRIELHSSWLPILEKIQHIVKEFYNINIKAQLSKKGFARLTFGNIESIKWIHSFSKDSFHMESKWAKLDNLYN